MTQKAVTACVLIIGTEILSGRTQDINLNHIALKLGEWGIQVREARVIPDVTQIIVDTVNETRARFDYVFTTGGIGPTHDDITAECIAEAFDVKLIVHPEIAARIERRPAPPDIMAARMLMARVPEGATLIDNLTGGPQGFRIENVFVMAGIPAVMQAMLASLEGKLQGGPIVRSRSLDPDELRSAMIAAFRGDSDSPGSSASARDTLCAAITHLSSVIEQLENLYRSAESVDDKIKLSSALGIATVRLSTLLRTQKYLALDQSSELYEEIQQAIYTVSTKNGAASNHWLLDTDHPSPLSTLD